MHRKVRTVNKPKEFLRGTALVSLPVYIYIYIYILYVLVLEKPSRLVNNGGSRLVAPVQRTQR